MPGSLLEAARDRGLAAVTLDVPAREVWFQNANGSETRFAWPDVIADIHKLHHDDLGREALWRTPRGYSWRCKFVAADPVNELASVRFYPGEAPPKARALPGLLAMVPAREVFLVGPKVFSAKMPR